jgi:hypothetical protein
MVTRRDIIDLVISRATQDSFTGNERDGEAPPITFQNFTTESFRLGARALRARLSRLPDTDLADEAQATLDLHEVRREWVSQRLARERSEQQAERGRKHGLQPEIVAAARHYRAQNKSAKLAWGAILEKPYTTEDGKTVFIEREVMHVRSPDGTQKRRGIKEEQWQRSYWPAGAKR